MLNPYVLLGGLLAVIAIATASFGFGHHVEYLSLVAYQKSQEAAAEKQLVANQTALNAQREADQAEMAHINQTHSGDLNEVTQRRDALLAANRNLTQRLWVATSPSVAKPVVSSSGAGGPVDAGGNQTEIPPTLAPWLIDRFTEADNDATLVTALQQVVVHDREVCNGSLPGVTPAQ